ncbi:AraC family transcriptional regulator [Paenibacillus pectinilyticus]|uniref:AraC family transcriptional regulator n=2 Tax=Paenibacillus pectinilyticus TaxID=512399 RepID=A0A1C1A0J1_9BACL|nr:AraC family transcriptional regulator [Paenibacillus pectinilyticus]
MVDVLTYQKLLEELIVMSERITRVEGRTPTIIPFLSITRVSHATPLVPSALSPSFCLILQGAKNLQIGQNMIHYHPGEYVASMIDMPASGQIVDVTLNSPYIAIRIDFTTQEIASVVTEAELIVKPRSSKLKEQAFIGKSDVDLLTSFVRLLQLIDKPKEARFRSELVKREMIFQLLSGDYGHLFFQQVLFEQQVNGIGKAIEWIKENYTSSFTIEELAKTTNMSVSGLHRKFKAVTTMGPLQFQKQLRLQEARRLMLSGTTDATNAALQVGYESPSQFNREYRRLFGLPPLKDIKTVRRNFEEGYTQNHEQVTVIN